MSTFEAAEMRDAPVWSIPVEAGGLQVQKPSWLYGKTLSQTKHIKVTQMPKISGAIGGITKQFQINKGPKDGKTGAGIRYGTDPLMHLRGQSVTCGDGFWFHLLLWKDNY